MYKNKQVYAVVLAAGKGTRIGFDKMLYKLDTQKPLDEQIANASTGETWADYFIGVALEDAKSSYALYNKAVAEKYELSEDNKKELESTIKMNKDMATIYGYDKVDDYHDGICIQP